MTREPFRIPSRLPVAEVKTYALAAPQATHFRRASCQEVECAEYARGWLSMIDVSTPLGQNQAYYIRMRSGRSFTASEVDGMVTFSFPAGQQCFAQHTVPLERDPILFVRGGDWRGNPSGFVRRHTRAEDWVDDFATHQQAIVDQFEKG